MADHNTPIRACLVVDDIPVNAIYMSRAQHEVFGYEPSERDHVFGWRELCSNVRFRLDELRRLADIVDRFEVRGKFTYLPYPAGWGRIDQTVRGYRDDDLAAMNAIVRDRLMPRFDITPEVMTHTMAILPEQGALLPHAESHYLSYLCREKRTEELAAYLRTAYQILHNVGVKPHGLTIGGMPDPSGIAQGQSLTQGHHRDVLAQVLLAVEREFDDAVVDSFIFTGSSPVQPQAADQRVPETIWSRRAESERVFEIHSIIDPLWFHAHGRGHEAMAVDRLITHDLESGQFVDDARHGRCLVFTVHGPTLNCLNSGLGFKVLAEVLRRLKERFGDQLQWCTAHELTQQVGLD